MKLKMLKIKKLEDKMEAKIDKNSQNLKFIKMIAKDEGYEKSNIQKRQWGEMEVENNGSKKAANTHIRLQTKSMKQVCDKRCALKKNL